ncbi:MAG: tRNA (adenosine(37)-N6)-threonylcarbamoyltransferase complex dimerization subunit type 1 TsaB [candidate division Zixibacteria bacterium]|nr:tRNA (adenosine(37)-N6)-threonylcarbamoyltransferase complex dimerization subunit type 1 TsaB [candidate division Zixibacteria bacterium]
MSDEYSNILAVDTTTRQLNLAALFGGDRSVKSSEVVPGTHGQILLKKIDDLLSSAGLAIRDLQAIVISLGPGSFTGLRIGLAAVKGIAVARDIPIVGVTLFEVAALCLKSSEGPAHVLVPSRKGEFYVGTFRDGAVRESDISVVEEDNLVARVGSDRVYTIGYDPLALAEGMPGLKARLLDYDAGDVLQVGLEKLNRGEKSDLASLEPVYLQKAIAEIRFDQKSRGK